MQAGDSILLEDGQYLLLDARNQSTEHFGLRTNSTTFEVADYVGRNTSNSTKITDHVQLRVRRDMSKELREGFHNLELDRPMVRHVIFHSTHSHDQAGVCLLNRLCRYGIVIASRTLTQIRLEVV